MLDAVINHSNLVDMGEGFNDRGRSFPPGTAGWGENGAIFRDKKFVAAAGDYFLNGKKIAHRDELGFIISGVNQAVNETAFPGFGHKGLGDYNFTMKNSVDEAADWEAWSYAEFDNPKPYKLILDAYKKFIDNGVDAFETRCNQACGAALS